MPAGIVVRPTLVTVVATGMTAAARPAFGNAGESATRFVYPFCTALWAIVRIVESCA